MFRLANAKTVPKYMGTPVRGVAAYRQKGRAKDFISPESDLSDIQNALGRNQYPDEFSHHNFFEQVKKAKEAPRDQKRLLEDESGLLDMSGNHVIYTDFFGTREKFNKKRWSCIKPWKIEWEEIEAGPQYEKLYREGAYLILRNPTWSNKSKYDYIHKMAALLNYKGQHFADEETHFDRNLRAYPSMKSGDHVLESSEEGKASHPFFRDFVADKTTGSENDPWIKEIDHKAFQRMRIEQKNKVESARLIMGGRSPIVEEGSKKKKSKGPQVQRSGRNAPVVPQRMVDKDADFDTPTPVKSKPKEDDAHMAGVSDDEDDDDFESDLDTGSDADSDESGSDYDSEDSDDFDSDSDYDSDGSDLDGDLDDYDSFDSDSDFSDTDSDYESDSDVSSDEK